MKSVKEYQEEIAWLKGKLKIITSELGFSTKAPIALSFKNAIKAKEKLLENMKNEQNSSVGK